MSGAYVNRVNLWNRTVLHSFVVMAVLLGLALGFSSALLHLIHQFDERIYYSIHLDPLYYRYAINLPLLAGAVATLGAMAWLCTQVFRQRWPKTYLVNVTVYFALFGIFFVLLESLDFGSFL
jgi:hypothetical protein